MSQAYICDAIRTPIGRYGGSLSTVRADDLAATPIKALMERNPDLDWSQLEEVYYGSANQAGEDNRNVARMAGLLAGLPVTSGGCTLNRLCASGMDAVGTAARAIKAGEQDLVIAGGVESMSRAPMVMPKADAAFSRKAEIFDTTIGWRFINKKMHKQFGTDSMPETAENVAEDYNVSREDQDAFALRSQQRAADSIANGLFEAEICSVAIPRRKQDDLIFAQDEQPRASSIEGLAKLPAPFREGGSVTAGNASSVNDGACALLLASEAAVTEHGLKPRARVLAMASAGVEPRIMGVGPIDAVKKVLAKTGLSLDDMDLIELNEAFAAQALAVTRSLGLADDDPRVNPQGGAIALGHPLGMSGARLVTTAVNQLERHDKQYALCTMCIGVGQGLAMIIEKV
jgi:3-oxoadipyl-CoA thiolase